MTLAVGSEARQAATDYCEGAFSIPILIVDDDPMKRLALRAVLAPLQYDVVEADSGRAALRCVMARDFAVILLDVLMPELNGFETAALIRQRRQSEMTPIIFVTAHTADEMLDNDLYAAGAVDFIFAPVPPKELRAKVRAFAGLFTRARDLASQAHEVQESVNELRMLTDAAPIGIFQTDIHGRYVYTNPYWSEITGTSADDAAGRDWDSFLDADPGADFAGNSAVLPARRGEICRRFVLHRSDSESCIVLVTSKLLTSSDGQGAGWVGTVADVTAEARAQAATADARDRATEASQLKSDFLANMSHEIRTPMNGVIGMIELLLETRLDLEQTDYAQTARHSGEALLTIIDEILDFSKLEAGRLAIEHIDFSVDTVVHDVVALLSTSAQDKQLTLTADIDGGLPAIVGGDPGRLRQILTNIVGNAIKFTEVGEIAIRVTGSESIGGTYLLRFEISDTGIGISDDRVDAIFQSFVQADSSTSRKYGGTGLGLTISAQLATLMGGVCGVTSRLGIGSNFWFSICVTPGSRASLRSGTVGPIELAGTAALVADDDATTRRDASRMLQDLGVDPSSANSGFEALAALRNARESGQPYTVAFISPSMDGMDCLDVQAEIEEVARDRTHIIALTPRGAPASLSEVASKISRIALSTPVRPNEFLDSLRAALGGETPGSPVGDSLPPTDWLADEQEIGLLLLAEDNLVNQKVAVAMLTSAGFRVDTVLDGAAAVKAARDRHYDTILMDCQMPEMSGYEATAAIRTQEGSEGHTPIIALTAGARDEDRLRCLAEGMDAYLSKPFKRYALISLVRQFTPRRMGAALDADNDP